MESKRTQPAGDVWSRVPEPVWSHIIAPQIGSVRDLVRLSQQSRANRAVLTEASAFPARCDAITNRGRWCAQIRRLPVRPWSEPAHCGAYCDTVLAAWRKERASTEDAKTLMGQLRDAVRSGDEELIYRLYELLLDQYHKQPNKLAAAMADALTARPFFPPSVWSIANLGRVLRTTVGTELAWAGVIPSLLGRGPVHLRDAAAWKRFVPLSVEQQRAVLHLLLLPTSDDAAGMERLYLFAEQFPRLAVHDAELREAIARKLLRYGEGIETEQDLEDLLRPDESDETEAFIWDWLAIAGSLLTADQVAVVLAQWPAVMRTYFSVSHARSL